MSGVVKRLVITGLCAPLVIVSAFYVSRQLARWLNPRLNSKFAAGLAPVAPVRTGQILARSCADRVLAERFSESPRSTDIVAVFADGRTRRMVNVLGHTYAAVRACRAAVYEDMEKRGGPQWCVSYGCKCLIAPGSIMQDDQIGLGSFPNVYLDNRDIQDPAARLASRRMDECRKTGSFNFTSQ